MSQRPPAARRTSLSVSHLRLNPILQGERDSFGKREEVDSYGLSPQVQVGWMTSGDHSFKPTKASGLSEAETWATAVELADSFLRELLSG